MKFVKKAVKYCLIRKKIQKNNRFSVSNFNAPTIYLFFVSCGTNMGDHAIVKAETNLIKQCLGQDVPLVEVKVSETEDAIEKLKNRINSEDIIVFSGGGYLGDEYIEVYLPMMRILKIFKNNKILVLPQTIYFKDKKRENKFTKLCKQCKELVIFVREQESKKIFNENGLDAFLVPDIVLSEKTLTQEVGQHILLCMRNDVERSLTSYIVSEITQIINERNKKVVVRDTVYDSIFEMKDRFEKLEQIQMEFSKASLVVTDRIHGMIFSYLSQTPCIAFSNYNHKVRSEYEWFTECNYIKYMDEYDEKTFRKMIDELDELKEYKTINFEEHFNILKGKLKEYYAKGL